jgi:CRISPR type II-A-associated protein Csn2
MKMQLYHFDNNVYFDGKYINILEIENKNLFVRFIESINDISNGDEPKEKIFFYKNDQEIELYNKIGCFIDIFNLELSSRKITNQLYSKINLLVQSNEELQVAFRESYNEMLELLTPVLNEFDFDLSYVETFQIIDLLKFINLTIVTKEKTLFEKLLLIIDLQNVLHIFEILIFVDIKKYFTKEEMLEIYKYSKYKEVNVLLIESVSSGVTLEYERKIIIDEHFQEFLLENKT